MEIAPIPSFNIEYIFFLIYRLFTGGADGFNIRAILSSIAPYSTVISLVFISIIIFCLIRINQIRSRVMAVQQSKIDELKVSATASSVISNPKWEKVLLHIESPNQNDWRLAIIEADVMLEEMINIMGYKGDTLSDKMRQVERSDFTYIDKAWEAHRVRNRIAHEGSDFELTEREARRVIDLYGAVFEEFHFI